MRNSAGSIMIDMTPDICTGRRLAFFHRLHPAHNLHDDAALV
jgi:hypothetical protein